MKSTVTLLHWGNAGPAELNAMKIVRFMGREIRPLQLTREAIEDEEFLTSALAVGGCLITSAQTLFEIRNRKPRGIGMLRLLGSRATDVFVYGFQPIRNHSLTLRELTSGGLLGVETLPPGDSTFRVDQNSRHICRQFAGLDFEAPNADTILAFVEGSKQSRCSSLIRIGQRPFFVCAKGHRCQWLLLADGGIADLDVAVPRKRSRLAFFSGLVPLMMFIASASGNEFWHSDAPGACFMVDDPLLKERYGFLEYRKLLAVMERERFCTSTAFIPWNFRRSDSRIAELFSAYSHRYSLCIHGCDHTGREFGATDFELLREKARTAIDRMRQHQRLSGLGFDDVMVFPQGVFSKAAMKALISCDYLAAVNSTPYPVDDENALTLRDLLEVAVTRFSNFPLFTRRSPENLAELAFDLFLGKPALLVEHHGFFREGYEALAGSVEKLYALDERLQWANLATTCSHACLKKVADNGDIHVLFFTDRFCLRNETDRLQRYVLVRRGSPEEASRAVTINGRPADICQEADCVRARVSLGAGQAVEVRVEHAELEPMVVPGRREWMYKAKVFIRRSFSEFRDNYLDKSPFLSKSARNLFARKNRRLPERS